MHSQLELWSLGPNILRSTASALVLRLRQPQLCPRRCPLTPPVLNEIVYRVPILAHVCPPSALHFQILVFTMFTYFSFVTPALIVPQHRIAQMHTKVPSTGTGLSTHAWSSSSFRSYLTPALVAASSPPLTQMTIKERR